MIRVLNLTGNAYQIGRQHGEQVADLRPQIENSMKIRLAELCKNDPDLSPYIDEINGIWERYAPDTLDMLKGISDSLHLDWEEYFTYTIASTLIVALEILHQIEAAPPGQPMAASPAMTHRSW
jgi:hypothetical protein